MVENKFSFATADTIIFGWGERHTVSQYAAKFGSHGLLLHSRSVKEIPEIVETLHRSGISVTQQVLTGEPTDEKVSTLADSYRDQQIDFIIGVGGGSVLDTGKALSALVTNHGTLLDYLEVVGRGLPLQNPPCPYIALPTTAGTGTEVTKNAVIKVTSKNVKVSMRNAAMIPDIALIDPELTVSLPPTITASTGMDAFIQVLEPYCSRNANKMVDMFCREGIPLAAKTLPIVYHNPTDEKSRTMMAWVSLLGGLSLANAKLGAVHGFAGPIGGMFDVPHGVICACLLPQVFKKNIVKVQECGDENLVKRFNQIAAWVLGEDNPSAPKAVEWFIALNEELSIPKLGQLGIKEPNFDAIIEKSLVSSSMKGNPVLLDAADLREILLNS
ncbi:MAG TPA: alcohol dehydrogenase [Anaerolineaceae bacterium]|nr:alcohol dehydrogenase [Anaerolineaceae bacterium]